MKLSRAAFLHAAEVLSELQQFAAPADETLSRFFHARRQLGPQERAAIAECAFAVLRRRRTLEAATGSADPQALVAAAAMRVLGLSARALEGMVHAPLLQQLRAFRPEPLPDAVRADLPDWLWQRLVEDFGQRPAWAIAQGMLNAAPLDLRVNLARATREEVLSRLAADGLQARPTPYSPAGVRLAGKPPINRHELFLEGRVEVQDEGSQLLAWLLAPRRGEMVADYCAGAGGKTLALAMLMRGTGRVYAMDISARRLAALGPRAARAAVTNVHSIALSGDHDPRSKRLAGKLDRVLVDAPCSGFGTLRRNPDLKWRHGPGAIAELAAKQAAILAAAARLVKPGGRLVYATCSVLREENEAVVARFEAAHAEFVAESCAELLAAQRIPIDTGHHLRLWPHEHGTDGFFAAAYRRRS